MLSYAQALTGSKMNICHAAIILVCILSVSNFAEGGQQRCKGPTKTIQNGKRTSQNTNYFKIDSTVRYWCYSGYVLRGNRRLKCILRNSRAMWAGTIPVCVGMYITVHHNYEKCRCATISYAVHRDIYCSKW